MVAEGRPAPPQACCQYFRAFGARTQVVLSSQQESLAIALPRTENRVLGTVYRDTGIAEFRSAITLRAFSARARAWGSSSRAFITSGSVSARTFSPSSWP